MELLTLKNIDTMTLRLGYACINTYLRELGVFTSRTCKLQAVRDNGLDHLYALIHKNIDDLAVILRWNHKNGIHVFRMSSDMFPLASHAEFYDVFDWSMFEEKLAKVGDLARQYDQRLSFHPGQYTLLTSHREEVTENSVRDLHVHARIMAMMGLSKDSVIVIHGGSTNGGKAAALDRFRTNWTLLNGETRDRIVLENCELGYSILELLPVCRELSIPLVVDYHHHNINNGGLDNVTDILPEALATWRTRGIRPKFHISESRPGVLPSDPVPLRRAHSDHVTSIPPEVYFVMDQGHDLDLMIEAKCKEQSIAHLRDSPLLKKKFSGNGNANGVL